MPSVRHFILAYPLPCTPNLLSCSYTGAPKQMAATSRRHLTDVCISSFLFLQCELLCQEKAFLAIASTAPDFIMLLSSMVAVPYKFLITSYKKH